MLFRSDNGTYETLWAWVRVVERDIVLRARSRSTIDNLVVGILLHHGKESIFNAILEWGIDDTLRISEVYLFAYKVVWHFIGVVTLLYGGGEHHILESDEFLLGGDTSIDNNPISAYNAITINSLQAEITKGHIEPLGEVLDVPEERELSAVAYGSILLNHIPIRNRIIEIGVVEDCPLAYKIDIVLVPRIIIGL